MRDAHLPAWSRAAADPDSAVHNPGYWRSRALAQEHVIRGVGRAAECAGLLAGTRAERRPCGVDPLAPSSADKRAGRRGAPITSSLSQGMSLAVAPGALPTTLAATRCRRRAPSSARHSGGRPSAVEQQRGDRLAERPGELAVAAGLALVDLRAFGMERDGGDSRRGAAISPGHLRPRRAQDNAPAHHASSGDQTEQWPLCTILSIPPAGIGYGSRHRLLEVLVDLVEEAGGGEPFLVGADQQRQVLGHEAGLDRVDA